MLQILLTVNLRRLANMGADVIGLAAFLGGVAIALAQVGYYLWSGDWHSISLIDIAALVAAMTEAKDVTWPTSPHTWLGLHAVLDWLPASVTLMVCGIAGMLYEMAAD